VLDSAPYLCACIIASMDDVEQSTVSNVSMVGTMHWNISAQRLEASHLSPTPGFSSVAVAGDWC
jgi:hypothetical protein